MNSLNAKLLGGAWRAVLLGTVLSLLACKAEAPPVLRDFRLLSLSAEGCAGQCPEYTLILDEHGQFRYTGRRNSVVQGAEKQLSEVDFEALKLRLDALIDKPWPTRFDARNCPSFNNGQSSLIWRLQTRGKSLELSQSLGCLSLPDASGAQDYYPPEWNQLYREIGRLSGLGAWVRGND